MSAPGMGGVVMRKMRAQDIPACAAIEAQVADGWSAAALRAELAQQNAHLFVAEAHGAVAGLAVFQLVCDEANLYAVSVAPMWQRKGIARALLEHAFCALGALGAQKFFLEVRAQNAPARALYSALGFAQIGLRRQFYSGPADDAVLMMRCCAATPANEKSKEVLSCIF